VGLLLRGKEKAESRQFKKDLLTLRKTSAEEKASPPRIWTLSYHSLRRRCEKLVPHFIRKKAASKISRDNRECASRLGRKGRETSIEQEEELIHRLTPGGVKYMPDVRSKG